jgi:hypothetical protein
MTLVATIQGMEMNIDIEKTVQLPDKVHVVQRLPFGEMTMVVNGDTGWAKSPMGDRELEPEQIEDQKKEIESDLLMLLAGHGGLQCQALPPEELDGHLCDRVYVTGAGEEYVLLFLDRETHLPYAVQSPGQDPMTQAAVTQQVLMGGYKTIDGFQAATDFTIKHDGEVFATGTLTSWEANPQLDAAMFQK